MGFKTKTLTYMTAASVIILTSVQGYAEVADFQSLINDSLAAKTELSHKLKQNIDQSQIAKTDKKIAKNDSRDRSPEREVNVAVRSKGVLLVRNRSRLGVSVEKNKMNRLSEEIENSH